MFRIHISRSPKSLSFKDQPNKLKFWYLKTELDFLKQEVEELKIKVK